MHAFGQPVFTKHKLQESLQICLGDLFFGSVCFLLICLFIYGIYLFFPPYKRAYEWVWVSFASLANFVFGVLPFPFFK